METFDYTNVDITRLKDIKEIKIDLKSPREKRIESFLNQIENPYCYRDGDIIVSIGYADTEVSIEDRLRAYASGLT